MRNSRNSLLIALLCVTGLMVFFQNCGRVGEKGLITSSSDESTNPLVAFHYPYSSAPKIFSQIQLTTAEAASNFSEITYLVAVASADDSSEPVDYEISIKNSNGLAVCPSQSGRLSEGAGSIVRTCLTQISTSEIIITARLLRGALTEEIQRRYQAP